MYKIKPLEQKKIEPYYKITFKYMIGDADGYVEEKRELEEKDFTEEVQNTLHVLNKYAHSEIPGYWANSFTRDMVSEALTHGLITQDDCDIIKREMKGEKDSLFGNEVYAERESYWVSIQDIKISYVDEDIREHEVVWED